MKVNWKVRFKNKVWLASFISVVVTFVYNILGMFDIIPVITQNTVIQIANEVLLLLSVLGVIVDPTTQGVADSKRALSYDEPWVDPVETK